MLASAVVEAASGIGGRGVAPVVLAAASPSEVVTALAPGRIDDEPERVADPQLAGDAPRRVAPSPDPSAPDAEPVSGGGDAPACRHADRPAINSGYDDWATTIVDTDYALPAGFEPPDLVPASATGIAGWALVRSILIDDLRALGYAARKAGNPVEIQSGYRSRERQAEVFAGWVASSGEAEARRYSARPGHSEHQLGTALDLRAAAGTAPWSGFGSTAAGRWVAAHAYEYGFILSYPAGAEAETCYGAEAWHIRYVGREVAAEVHASGLPLRVWLFRNASGG